MHTIRVYLNDGKFRGCIATFIGLDAEKQLQQSKFYNNPNFSILR